MKTQINIILFSFLLTILISFLVFNFDTFGLTGFAIQRDSEISSSEVLINQSFAFESIDQAKVVIQRMNDEGFTLLYVNDLLLQANHVFQKARYADILRTSSGTPEEIIEARQSLKFINLDEISYNEVLIYTNRIIEREKDAILLRDSYFLLEKEVFESESFGYNMSLARYLLSQANVSFYEDRYDESLDLFDDVRSEIENQKAGVLTAKGFRKSLVSFFQDYWFFILITLILFLFLFFHFNKKLKYNLLKSRIDKMKAQLRVLDELMRETQEERFKKNEISGIVYEIRMKRYRTQIQEIKQLLPVLESSFQKMSKSYNLVNQNLSKKK